MDFCLRFPARLGSVCRAVWMRVWEVMGLRVEFTSCYLCMLLALSPTPLAFFLHLLAQVARAERVQRRAQQAVPLSERGGVLDRDRGRRRARDQYALISRRSA